MTEGDARVHRGVGLGRGHIEPLSPQAWQRVESAVFSRLDAAAVPWSLVPAPLHSYAAPRPERPLRLHWAASVGLALAAATAAASVLHLLRPPPQIEAGPPAELMLPAEPPPSALAPPAHDAIPLAADPSHAQPAESAADPAVALSFAAEPPRPSPLAPTLAARPAARRDTSAHNPPVSDRERLFARAASFESADAALALALYLSLASGDDDWGANALYAAARLELDRGLRDAGAKHLTEYLARFPRGENVVDVRGLGRRIGLELD